MAKYIIISSVLLLFSFTWEASLDLREASEDIARRYCGTCHEFPEPELLDRITWEESVLPNMGARLGIETKNYDPYVNVASEELKVLKRLNIYPEQQLISNKDWKAIKKYYKSNAPETLPEGEDEVDMKSTAPFTVQLINTGDGQIPQVSLLEFDQSTNTLYLGDGLKLFSIDTQGYLTGNWDLNSPAVDIVVKKDETYLLNVGSIVPSDQKLGSFSSLSVGADDSLGSKTISKLPRPVYSEVADINGDSKMDALISSFGHNQGKLSWFDDFGEENVISNLPGNRRTETVDFDGDGDLDIISLNAQAWEGLSIFYNNGKGKFVEDRILKFSPVHGVSYFEMVDFNSDGHLDILLTNGDSYDYSPIKKPYHGVHIYMNDGKNSFEEEFFFHHSGCNKAMSADFDGDGDQDIIVSAFYDLLADANQSIMYLENKGGLEFSPTYFKEAFAGNWLTMDIGDINEDGFPDVFLGSYYYNLNAYNKASRNGKYQLPQVLMLINSNGKRFSFNGI